MDGERCILDDIAGIDLYPFGAVADRPEVSGDVPPAGSVAYATKPRPGWMVDAYLATTPGTAEAINALAAAIIGSNERKPPPAAAVRRRQRKLYFTNGKRPADYTPDCPTPDEIEERCAANRAEWTEKERKRRMTGQSEKNIDTTRRLAASDRPRRKPKRAVQTV